MLIFDQLDGWDSNTFKKKNNFEDGPNFYFNGIIFNETYIYVIIRYAPGDRFEYISRVRPESRAR